MGFNIFKTITLLQLFCITSCKEPATKPPPVKFDFSKMPEEYKSDTTSKVIDKDELFSEKEKIDLEFAIEQLQKQKSITVHIFTDPSTIRVNNEWVITKSVNYTGVTIIIFRSNKTIHIGIESRNDKGVVEKNKKEILLLFTKGYFYKGVSLLITDLTEG